MEKIQIEYFILNPISYRKDYFQMWPNCLATVLGSPVLCIRAIQNFKLSRLLPKQLFSELCHSHICISERQLITYNLNIVKAFKMTLSLSS